MDKENWHNLSVKEIIQKLNTNLEKGLSEREAQLRIQEFGKNSLPPKKSLSKLGLFLSQFKSPLIYILLIAAFIVLFLKEYSDAIVIFAAILVNAVVGYFQELKADKSLEKLKKAVKIKAKVLRDGHEKLINAENLVPGDIIILEAGDKVPADARLFKCQNLKINEMALTGEWLPVSKKEVILAENTPLADRDNMVFMGTIVENGEGMAVVVSTGLKTELGKISKIVSETKEEETPIQKRLKKFSRFVGLFILFLVIFIFLEGIIKGRDFLEVFLTSVAIAVAAIPEGLPIAITAILALGMQRVLRKGGLIRKLSSAETLGSVAIIATDKTGTLTEGKMKVAEVIAEKESDYHLALKIAALCSQAFIENPDSLMEKWIIRGAPTDRALLFAAIEAGINREKIKQETKEILSVPFNSINKYSAKILKEKNKNNLYISGAPEILLEKSAYFVVDGKNKKLSKKKQQELEEKIKNMAEKGLRVIAVAIKNNIKYSMVDSEKNNLDEIVKNLSFVGLIALKDPLRFDVKKSIKACFQAGIRPIIVTGDHKLTAKAVADEIGLNVKDDNIIEGIDLENLSDKELYEKVEKFQIYARVEPKHKLRIVKAWQDKGKIIAMTGDGVNDAPALKKADAGIALGSGTEVAKEVSDLILLTNSFNVILVAIEEGRAIIDNIRKVITYLLSGSFTETILVGVSIFLGLPLPVTATQILWVNLVEDGLPNIALSFEPKEKDLMSRKPLKKESPLLTKEMKFLIVVIGLLTDIILLALFLWLHKFSNYSIEHIRTIIFVGLAIDSLLYVFSCKSLRRNIWEINIFSNKILNFAWIFGVIMILGAVYLPFLQFLLKTYPLGLFDWGLILGFGLINIILIELTKWYFIKKKMIN